MVLGDVLATGACNHLGDRGVSVEYQLPKAQLIELGLPRPVDLPESFGVDAELHTAENLFVAVCQRLAQEELMAAHQTGHAEGVPAGPESLQPVR